MPRVNLYVRDSDMPTWDRARTFTKEQDGDSLSSFVAEALGRLLDERERQVAAQKETADKMKAIELRGYDWHDTDRPRKLRFTGACVAESGKTSAYLTRSEKIILESDTSRETILAVFDSFEELESSEVGGDLDGSFMLEIAEALGRDYAEEIE